MGIASLALWLSADGGLRVLVSVPASGWGSVLGSWRVRTPLREGGLLSAVSLRGAVCVGALVPAWWSWEGARNYCTSNGMRASSLDTQAKVRTAYNLVRPLKYFWTGGSVNHGRRTVSWPNGATSTPDWSPTGG